MTASKIAIVLRGPPCVGKTKLCHDLLAGLRERGYTAPAGPIVLDDGWQRCFKTDGRYTELTTTDFIDCSALVIEICCAEPIFQCGNNWLLDARPGATRNPAEWVAILKDQRRTVRSFLLCASWHFVRSREEHRQKLDIPFCRLLYDFYSLRDWRDFAAKAEIPETILNVEVLDRTEIENLIWTECGILPAATANP